jgi:hypothetical protein
MEDPVNDRESLARWRQLYPYISLSAAKALHRTDRQFGHLGALKKTQERAAAQEKDRQLREGLFGVPPDLHSGLDV